MKMQMLIFVCISRIREESIANKNRQKCVGILSITLINVKNSQDNH